MRTGEGAALLLSLSKLIKSAVNNSLAKMAPVQQSSGYQPPSGIDEYEYWKSAADAKLIPGAKVQI